MGLIYRLNEVSKLIYYKIRRCSSIMEDVGEALSW